MVSAMREQSARSVRERRARPAGPVPGASALREAALAYLSRFAATEAGLARVLDRRIERWAALARAEGDEDVDAAAAGAREQVRALVRDLARSGALDDRLYAEARARSLARAGRSRRAVLAQLAAKGVAPEIAAAALPPPEHELAQALSFARRRRLGPFRGTDAASPEQERRELASLARAGFPPGVARRALQADPEDAEALVSALRRE
jgi:regulatory protein